jgi:hypothetical protein
VGNGSGGTSVITTESPGSGGAFVTTATGGVSGGDHDAAIGIDGSTVNPTSTGGNGGSGAGGGGGGGGLASSGGSGGSTVNPTSTGGSGGVLMSSGGNGGSTVHADAATDVKAHDGSANGDGGTGGTVGCDKDLTGTWDLYTTSLATGSMDGVLIVGSNGFNISTRGDQLIYTTQGTMSATWKTSEDMRAITVKNTPATLNGGSIPLALGGVWTLAVGSETCTLDVAKDAVKGKCKNSQTDDRDVAGYDWPDNIPSPANGVNYLISRTSTLPSQFGDFGGQWTATPDDGNGQSCIVKLDGNSITTNCQTDNEFNGVMHLTIGSDCVASGTTPSGLEVSARRR